MQTAKKAHRIVRAWCLVEGLGRALSQHSLFCCCLAESSEEESDDEVPEKDSDVSDASSLSVFYPHCQGAS